MDDSSSQQFQPKLPARITGIVFWGLVFVGLLVAIILLERVENELTALHKSNVRQLSYEIEESLESQSLQAVFDIDNTLFETKIEQLRAEMGFTQISIIYRDQELNLGELSPDDDAFPHKIHFYNNQTGGVDAASLLVHFPDQEGEIALVRKNMLLSIGLGVFIFGLILQQILTRILSRPFVNMVGTASQFSEGNETVRFDEARNDEFGYLGKFINDAIEAILKHQDELELAIDRVTQSEQELHKKKEFSDVTLLSITESVITVSVDELIQYMNPAAERLLGIRLEEASGQYYESIINIIGDNSAKSITSPVKDCFATGEVVRLPEHVSLVNGESSVVAIEATVAPMKNKEGDLMGGVIVIKDVSHTRKLTRQLSYQASHDMLTGLYNRRKFEEYLEETLLNVREESRVHSLCFLDLDQFKIVNDTCGHVAGDELLQQLPVIFNRVLRSGDVIARLGGDEFGVLLENCDLKQAAIIADKIRQQIKEFRFVWQDKTFEIGVSIGVVGITGDNIDMAEVMSAADVACYAAKESGRNRVHVFETSDKLISEKQGQMHWTARITQAMSDDRFRLYQQKIIGLNGTEGAHIEVLIRMVDDDGNVIPPGAFLPAAERYKLMSSIDRWVVAEVFRSIGDKDASVQLDSDFDMVAINLSGESLSDEGFLHYILEQKDKFGVDMNDVCFEITETVAISNITRATKFISELRNYGCRFALDDFGSGLSSFAYLKALPVNFLKIDGSFIKDIVHDDIDHAMVQSINQIGKVMDLETIAERVESEQILDVLRDMGVDFAQGYHIGRPEPLH